MSRWCQPRQLVRLSEAGTEGIGEATWDTAMPVRGVDSWMKASRHRTVHAWQGTVVL